MMIIKNVKLFQSYSPPILLRKSTHKERSMTLAHNLGFPRIGARRELKHAQEAYWRGEPTAAELAATGKILRRRHWQVQADAGLDLIPVGDFSWYDHLLDLSTLLGVVPPLFGGTGGEVDLDTY